MLKDSVWAHFSLKTQLLDYQSSSKLAVFEVFWNIAWVFMRNCLSFEFFRALVFSKPKSSSISAFRQVTRRNRLKIVKKTLLMMNKMNITLNLDITHYTYYTYYTLTLQRYWNPLCHNFARVWLPPKRLPLLCRSALINANLWMVKWFQGLQPW